MILCQSCGAVCGDSLETCPTCGVSIARDGDPHQDAAYLAKDSWAIENETADDTVPTVADPPDTRPDTTAALESIAMKHPFQSELEQPVESRGLSHFNPNRASDGETAPAAASPSKTMEMVALKPPQARVAKSIESGVNTSLKSTIMGIGAAKENASALDLAPPAPTQQAAKPEPLVIESTTDSQNQTDRMEEIPKQVDVHVSPNRIGALSRDDDDRFYGRQKNAVSGGTQARKNNAFSRVPDMSIILGISSALLLTTWIVPNTLTDRPIFPFTLMTATHGTALIALLAEPVCGALLLALLLAPMQAGTQALASLLVGSTAMTLPLLFGTPALPVSGAMLLTAASGGILIATVIFLFLRIPLLGHLALILVPGGLFASAVIGVLNENLPATHLVVFKDPLKLYASMLVTSIAAASLIQNLRSRR